MGARCGHSLGSSRAAAVVGGASECWVLLHCFTGGGAANSQHDALSYAGHMLTKVATSQKGSLAWLL